MIVNRNIVTNSINEVVQIIDAEKSEMEYAMTKYKSKIDFIDLEARNIFLNRKIILSMIKYSHRYNHYGLRNALINNNIIGVKCSRCSKVEM